MKIQVKTGHTADSSRLRQFAYQRLRLSLGRFQGRIRSAAAHWSAAGGWMNGHAICAHVVVTLVSGRKITAADLDECPFTALRRASERAARTVARQLEFPNMPLSTGKPSHSIAKTQEFQQ